MNRLPLTVEHVQVVRTARARLAELKPRICDCEHEIRAKIREVTMGEDYREASWNAFCIDRHDNPNCAHNDDVEWDARVLIDVIRPLYDIGVLGDEWLGWNHEWKGIIGATDDKARLGVMNNGRIPLVVTENQKRNVAEIEARRQMLSGIIDAALGEPEAAENNVLVA
jgi:hypothetical protein